MSLRYIMLQLFWVYFCCYYYYYIISFMQGIHTYIPGTNHVSSVHSVAAIPRLLLMVHIMLSSILNSFLCLYISTFRNMCAVPNIAVFFGVP
jgi:hypothetical protein